MGACNFTTSASGETIAEAYNIAVEEAIAEFGEDSYNGTISTTRGVINKTKLFEELLEKADNDLRKAVSEFEDIALDRTFKCGDCYGAHIKDNLYVFTGWAAE